MASLGFSVRGASYPRRMGKITFDTATSLNGWIADEDNSLAWLFAVDGGTTPDDEVLPANAGVLVEGSTTYEWILAEEDILANPEKWQNFHGDRPTFVFTTRDLPVPTEPMFGSSRDPSQRRSPPFVKRPAIPISG